MATDDPQGSIDLFAQAMKQVVTESIVPVIAPIDQLESKNLCPI